jgi:hypothetical protein
MRKFKKHHGRSYMEVADRKLLRSLELGKGFRKRNEHTHKHKYVARFSG